MICVVSVAKEFEYLSDMFACLIASTKGNVFTGRCGFDDEFFGVRPPVKKEAIKVQCVGACALAGVWLTGEVDVDETSEGEGVSRVYIILLLLLVIDMCDPIIGVKVVNIIGSDGVGGFAPSFRRGVARH